MGSGAPGHGGGRKEGENEEEAEGVRFPHILREEAACGGAPMAAGRRQRWWLWLLAPTNVTSDDASIRQFGVAVFHEPRINRQAQAIPL